MGEVETSSSGNNRSLKFTCSSFTCLKYAIVLFSFFRFLSRLRTVLTHNTQYANTFYFESKCDDQKAKPKESPLFKINYKPLHTQTYHPPLFQKTTSCCLRSRQFCQLLFSTQ